MICKNCHADFDDNLPSCPYCGAFHYAGAEKAYMDKLNDFEEDLDTLHDTVPKMYSAELKNQVKLTKKIILLIAGILGALVLLIAGISFIKNVSEARNEKEVLLFMKTAYPIADEFYEAEDYEGLLEFYQTFLYHY